MIKSPAFYFWHRLVSIALLLSGAYLLSINVESIRNRLGYSGFLSEGKDRSMKNFKFEYDWIDTAGVSLTNIQGDPTVCNDVIYTGHTLDPFGATAIDEQNQDMISKGWEGMAHIVRTSPVLKGSTCFAFFLVSSPWIDENDRELHPVWGRLPATALVMSAFPNADIFLYMDSDALLASPHKSPTMMYDELSFDGYGDAATSQQLRPGLIVNKPQTGWLCGQCEKFGLGHGCFNSGALLWHRANAEPILRAWWASRNMDESQNFFDPETGESFHGWNGKHADRVGNKMGEQNRLMYVYGSDPSVREIMWPVPRQKSKEFNSESCPNAVDEDHTPCLQNDWTHTVKWKPSGPSCFISHYPDEKHLVAKHAEEILRDSSS
eukprot:CAMPEP_0197184386 /NCGR_PEP_ID=MMETSP1423-20130617/9775_1 /TAXON_ID=476441 /ORGANISM="Pseudo-nitzschia heimii, Strain UNC1101" /LENGTH=377 /DNA_ID=CAMNT_0042635183 /DNA_START=80 /DNA_END=1213 /DNA_ORIENTATION=-